MSGDSLTARRGAAGYWRLTGRAATSQPAQCTGRRPAPRDRPQRPVTAGRPSGSTSRRRRRCAVSRRPTPERSTVNRTSMAGLPAFEVGSAAATAAAATTASGLAAVEPSVDSVTTLSVLLMMAYMARATFPNFFKSLLDERLLAMAGLTTPNSTTAQKSRVEEEDEWWHFPIHLLALWQMRHQPHQQACARRLVCDHVTAGTPDPFFDFAIGGVAYMMGASGSLSMVDKLQSLENEVVDCERLVPECEGPKLREAMSLGTTIQKFSAMVAEWLGW
ncbi:uncharacterized protein LOC122385071 [Amphibalanus amphitrite]|uniref:uncharacterized protein LOC122385071 n=1 Tax=Amphibalanus amphitrite TaxID=1232801 RepID=UPI001C915D34|nr:uncharacterized protein LOC122385071 [Amphibalanus amphitrite]